MLCTSLGLLGRRQVHRPQLKVEDPARIDPYGDSWVRPVPRWPSCRCRPCGRVGEVVTGRREQRTDRPSAASGTTAVRTAGVRHTRTGWTWWRCWCPRRSDPWTGVRPPTGRRPSAGHQHGHLVIPAVATADMATHAAGHTPGTTATAGHGPAKRGEHGRRPVAMATPGGPAGNSSGLAPATAGHLRCGRPACRPGPDTRGHVPPPVSPGGCGGYGNRSSGWRPLVGCSQRRWARASRAVRLPAAVRGAGRPARQVAGRKLVRAVVASTSTSASDSTRS
jgi:hypothetical protein